MYVNSSTKAKSVETHVYVGKILLIYVKDAISLNSRL